MSTLPRTSRAFFVLSLIIALSGCDFSAEKEASKRVGDQPKKIIDKATVDVNKAMQQGAERLEKKE